jgi:hypothetical protein
MGEDAPVGRVLEAALDLESEVKLLHDVRLCGALREALDQPEDLVPAHTPTLLLRKADFKGWDTDELEALGG